MLLALWLNFFDFFIKLSKVPRPMWSRLMTLLHIGKIQVISNRRLWLANGFVKNVRVSHLYWRFLWYSFFFRVLPILNTFCQVVLLYWKLLQLPTYTEIFRLSTFSMFLKSCLRKYFKKRQFEEIEINYPLRKICVCRNAKCTNFD